MLNQTGKYLYNLAVIFPSTRMSGLVLQGSYSWYGIINLKNASSVIC